MELRNQGGFQPRDHLGGGNDLLPSTGANRSSSIKTTRTSSLALDTPGCRYTNDCSMSTMPSSVPTAYTLCGSSRTCHHTCHSVRRVLASHWRRGCFCTSEQLSARARRVSAHQRGTSGTPSIDTPHSVSTRGGRVGAVEGHRLASRAERNTKHPGGDGGALVRERGWLPALLGACSPAAWWVIA